MSTTPESAAHGPAAPASAAGGRRLALLVANAVYEDAGLRALRAPATDAQALAAVLADPIIGNCETKLVLDRPSYEIAEEIEAFCADRRRDDLLVMYFSCHGVKDEDGVLYLAAANTKLSRLKATGLPSAFVKDQVEHTRSRRVLLLLDCCYSGAFGPLGPKSDGGVGVTERLSGHGRAVITASSAMEYSFEQSELATGAGVRSVFTDSMVCGLSTGVADADGDGLISVDELYDYVYGEVRRKTPSQTPHMVSDLEGELYLATSPLGPRPGASAVALVNPPQPQPPPARPMRPYQHPGPAVVRSRRTPQGRRWALRAMIGAALALVVGAAVLVWHPSAPGWRALPDMLLAEEGAGVGVYEGGLWVAGGVSPMTGRPLMDSVQIFDPVGRRWSQGPRLPRPVAFAALVPAGPRLYLVGGQAADGAVDTVLRLDNPNSTWQPDVPLPQPREAGAAAWDGSRIVYAGGVGSDHRASSEVYGSGKSGWQLLGKLAVAREKAAVASDGFGTVWVVGGRDSDTSVAAYGDVDEVHNGRIVASSAVSPVQGAAAVYWPGSGVCTVGGQTPNGFTGEVRCLVPGDPPPPLPPLPQPRAGVGVAVLDGQVIAVGGYDVGYHGTARADELATTP